LFKQNISSFGSLGDGRKVEKIVLNNRQLRAEILTLGATIRDLRFAGHPSPLVLGLNTVDDYLEFSRYFGASVGRCANRIAAGKFTLDETHYQLECNETGGRNHLHGGRAGMAWQIWTIREASADKVVLWIRDEAGNEGYPGTVETTCTIELLEEATLAIRYESVCDLPTLVNICHHGYFNLGKSADVLDHTIRIAADQYLAVDAHKIPLSPPLDVTGSPFDLRQQTLLGARVKELNGGFDHNFCLSSQREALRPVAWVKAPGGLAMEVATTEPGVQFFTPANLQCPVEGLEGRRYGAYAGLCLETQIWPDAINQTDFPTVILRHGEKRCQETHYRFSHA